MNKTEIRKITLHGMLYQALYWFGFCTYIVFMVTTLIDHGWSAGAAAASITVMSVITMVMQPVYGYLCDKYISEKKLSVILLSLTVVSLLLLPLSLRSESAPLIIVNMIGVTVTGAQVGSLIDAWIVGLKQEQPSINYGLIRGAGSFAYALSAQIAGAITIAFRHSVRIWIGGGFYLLAVFVAMTFRPAKRSSQTNEEKSVRQLNSVQAFKLVFSSKQYCLLMAVSFFLMLNTNAMTTVLQLIIRDFGGTTAQIGTASAVMAGSEVPFMFLMAYFLKKIGFKKLLLFCSLVYVVRMFVSAFAVTVNGLIYAQLLQGLTYAVLMPIIMSYLSQILDERVRSMAVTTFAAVTTSLSGILGNLITSTFLAAGLSAQNALVFFAFSALLGFLLALYGALRKIWEIKPAVEILKTAE